MFKKNDSASKALLKKTAITKPTKSLFSTLAMLVIFYVVCMILEAAGAISFTIQNLLIDVCIYAVAAVSLNLCLGYLGELSLGHGAFMSLGAFSSALFTNLTRDTIESDFVRFLIGLLIGILVAAVFGFLIGIPVLRLNGDYLAIVTLGFGEIVKGILNVTYVGYDDTGVYWSFISDRTGLDTMAGNAKMVINGAKGITGTSKLSTFTGGMVILIIAVVICGFLVNSRTGRASAAIRDNRIAAESVGINITKYKMITFTISAAIAGSAGVLYSHFLSSMTAVKFDFNMSILLLVFVVLGGIGSFKGAIIAAVLLTALPELLRGLSDYRMLIYAILLIVMMLLKWAPKSIELREKLKQKNERYRVKRSLEKKES